MCKSHFFLKFQVFREWSSDITSFVGNTVSSILKVENVWNIVCWFSFDNSCSNFMSKSYLLLNFWELFHVQILFVIEFLQRSIDIFFFLEHPVYSSFDVQSVLIRYCCFYFVASYLNYTCNSTCHILGARVLGVLRKKGTILLGHPKKWPDSC